MPGIPHLLSPPRLVVSCAHSPARSMLLVVTLLAGLALLLAVARVHAQALVFDPNAIVVASEGAPVNNRPRVAATDDGGSHILWARGETNHEGAFVVSAPPGGNYGSAIMLSQATTGVASGGGSGPTLRAAGSYLVAGWEDRNANNRAILVARSTDMGTTWEPSLRADPFMAALRAYQAAAVFPDGRMAQSWMTYDPGWLNPGFAFSAQNGQGIFLPPIDATAAAAGEACECCFHDQLVLDDGQTVLLAYRNNEENLREIHVARSIDGGASFPTATRVDTSSWIIAGCPSTGPGLAADGNTVLACWKSAPGGQAHIWMARSLDGGASWESMRQVDDGDGITYINYPQVAIRGSLAVIVWEGTGPGPVPEILASASMDAGQTWGESAIVTDAPGYVDYRQPSVAVLPDGDIEVVWRDSRLGARRIFHARGRASQVGVGESAPQAVAPRFLTPYPNPSRATATNIEFLLPRAGHARLALFDASGRHRVVLAEAIFSAGLNRVTWHGRDERGRILPAGLYFARLETAGYTGLQKLLIVH